MCLSRLAQKFILATALACVGLVVSSAKAQYVQTTILVDSDINGVQADLGAWNEPLDLSSDGRYVVFISDASNLVPGYVQGYNSIFVKDLWTGAVELISKSSAGVQADSHCRLARISGDGRYVVFVSDSANLVPSDANGFWDVFVHDRWNQTTECVSVDLSGVPSNSLSTEPSISLDGRFVCFTSFSDNIVPQDWNWAYDVFVRDLKTGTTSRVSLGVGGLEGDGSSKFGGISGDGNFVAFVSSATNLVPNDTNGEEDHFVRDLSTGFIERINVDSNGVQAAFSGSGSKSGGPPSLSSDGRFAVFSSPATNLVLNDTNGVRDIFLRDRALNATERISVNSFEQESLGPAFSGPFRPHVSDDGRYVSYSHIAPDLVGYDANGFGIDVYLRDRVAGVTKLVNLNNDALQADQQSNNAGMTPDGRYIVFTSTSSTFLPGDTNGAVDVFRRDMLTGGADVELMNATAGQIATLQISAGTPGGLVVLGASLGTQANLSSPWGPLDLGSAPVLFAFVLDAAGSLSTSIPLSPALIGQPLWVQGVDVFTDWPTSTWAGIL